MGRATCLCNQDAYRCYLSGTFKQISAAKDDVVRFICNYQDSTCPTRNFKRVNFVTRCIAKCLCRFLGISIQLMRTIRRRCYNNAINMRLICRHCQINRIIARLRSSKCLSHLLSITRGISITLLRATMGVLCVHLRYGSVSFRYIYANFFCFNNGFRPINVLVTISTNCSKSVTGLFTFLGRIRVFARLVFTSVSCGMIATFKMRIQISRPIDLRRSLLFGR